MNAYLMAAGMATRLMPLTQNFPKCLLKVYGVEILECWLHSILLTKEFNSIYINVHHCASMVEKWIEKFKKQYKNSYSEEVMESIKIIDESKKLLGTAGTLFWHGDMQDDFMVCYVDTYSKNFMKNLGAYVRAWKDNPDPPLAGLFSFNLPEDRSAGSMDVDFIGTVTSFEEKSSSGLVGWAGMMFARNDFFDHIYKHDKDLSKDVFPRLCGKIRVIGHVDAYDIGRGLDEYESFIAKSYQA